MSLPLALQLAGWVSGLVFDDLPDDVVEASKLRILDVVGLTLAGSGTPFGCSTRAAAVALSPPGPCRVLGTGARVRGGARGLRIAPPGGGGAGRLRHEGARGRRARRSGYAKATACE